MVPKNLDHILTTILHLIQKSEKILVVVSQPIDPDCVGTGLALKWWLAQRSKKVEIVSFFQIPESMSRFPGIREIEPLQGNSFNFSRYDLIMLLDGSDWPQFFGDDWNKIVSQLDLNKVVNLDHHEAGEIQGTIPDRCLRVTTSSTAQLLYDFFIKPGSIEIPPQVAGYLYLALLYDSRMFKNEIHAGEYSFADALISSGVDHDRAVDANYDIREIKFMSWAVQHTEFFPDLQLTLLNIDSPCSKELTQEFGKNWKDFDKLYKEQVQRQIKDYHYGIILIDNMDGTVKLGWRTRNYGNHLSIAEVARRAGFRAGGHRNAGGGKFSGTIGEAKTRLLEEMRKALNGI